MVYNYSWTTQDSEGKVTAGKDYASRLNLQELATAIKRRLKLCFVNKPDCLTVKYISSGDLAQMENLITDILDQPAFTGGLYDSKPFSMRWINPLPDTNSNKLLTSSISNDRLCIYELVNGRDQFTRALDFENKIRALHINELRKVVEILRMGCWQSTVSFMSGIFTDDKDFPFAESVICNNNDLEIRAIGRTALHDTEGNGLSNVTIRPESSMQFSTSEDCKIAVYRCKRRVDVYLNQPTWNQYNPEENLNWSTPGGLGESDAELIGTGTISGLTPITFSGTIVQQTLQAIANGAPCNFIVKRLDTGSEFINVSGCINAYWEINSPPA